MKKFAIIILMMILIGEWVMAEDRISKVYADGKGNYIFLFEDFSRMVDKNKKYQYYTIDKTDSGEHVSKGSVMGDEKAIHLLKNVYTLDATEEKNIHLKYNKVRTEFPEFNKFIPEFTMRKTLPTKSSANTYSDFSIVTTAKDVLDSRNGDFFKIDDKVYYVPKDDKKDVVWLVGKGLKEYEIRFLNRNYFDKLSGTKTKLVDLQSVVSSTISEGSILTFSTEPVIPAGEIPQINLNTVYKKEDGSSYMLSEYDEKTKKYTVYTYKSGEKLLYKTEQLSAEQVSDLLTGTKPIETTLRQQEREGFLKKTWNDFVSWLTKEPQKKEVVVSIDTEKTKAESTATSPKPESSKLLQPQDSAKEYESLTPNQKRTISSMIALTGPGRIVTYINGELKIIYRQKLTGDTTNGQFNLIEDSFNTQKNERIIIQTEEIFKNNKLVSSVKTIETQKSGLGVVSIGKIYFEGEDNKYKGGTLNVKKTDNSLLPEVSTAGFYVYFPNENGQMPALDKQTFIAYPDGAVYKFENGLGTQVNPALAYYEINDRMGAGLTSSESANNFKKYVETSKGGSLRLTIAPAVSFLGGLISASEQFPGLSAFSSLIKDKQYNEAVSHWKEQVYRHFTENLVGMGYFKSKICERTFKTSAGKTFLATKVGSDVKGAAYIQVDKTKTKININSALSDGYIYRTTFFLSNPHNEDMIYNIFFKSKTGKNVYWFLDNNKQPENILIPKGQSVGQSLADFTLPEKIKVKIFETKADYVEACLKFSPKISTLTGKKTGEFCMPITEFKGKPQDYPKQQTAKTSSARKGTNDGSLVVAG